MSSHENADIHAWFVQGELARCPLCGRGDTAATTHGTLYCLSCGELVGPRLPAEGPDQVQR
jgi:hypothetical protein